MKTGSTRGLFGNWLPMVNGEKFICSHFHRTPGGAERCAKVQARFQKRVEKFKKEMSDANQIW